MPLTELNVRAAKPAAKPYKLSDERGLYLHVQPSGGRLWRLKYRHGGREKLLALGRYPDVTLKLARERREEARRMIAEGKDPSAEKRRAAVASRVAASSTFGLVAREFIDKMEREGRSGPTLTKARWILGLLKGLEDRPVSAIEPFELLEILRPIEAGGRHETARRVRAFASRVFLYGIATTRARHNPAADLAGALVAPRVTHHAAILEGESLGGLLRAIEGFTGQPSTKLALQLAPHVFVRPGELRQAEWSEIDLEADVWRIPGRKTKMRREHVVPLSRQARAILEEAALISGGGRYVFPGIGSRGRPMSENTLNGALRRLGYGRDEMTSHGFRSTASTLLNESGLWSRDAIERALGHREGDEVRSAYDRGERWPERVRMAQWWSDYLDSLRDGVANGGKPPMLGA